MKIVVIGGTGLIGSKLVEKLRQARPRGARGVARHGRRHDHRRGAGRGARGRPGRRRRVERAGLGRRGGARLLPDLARNSWPRRRPPASATTSRSRSSAPTGSRTAATSARSSPRRRRQGGAVPYTILRATQFFEFIGRIADSSTEGDTVRLPPVLFQPEAADDVAAALADIAVGAPVNGIVELAGPEPFRFDELVRRFLDANNDPRHVIADVHARYYGTELDERSLTPAATHASLRPASRTGSASPRRVATAATKGDPHETDDRSRPRRVRRVGELGRRHRPAARRGHPVIAAANPLRGLAADAAAVSDLVRTIDGPVVLVAPLLRRRRDLQRRRRRRRDHRARLRQRPSRPIPARPASRSPGGSPAARSAMPLRPVPRSDGTTDLYIVQRPLPRPVLRGRAGATGGADGGDAAAGDAGGAHRARRASGRCGGSCRRGS